MIEPTERARERRRATYRAGQLAELAALLALALKGYRILARRYVVKGGEVDIIARRGQIVAFVEVKARPTREEALDAITPWKCRRIARAAAVWLVRNPSAAAFSLRGDAMVVTPRRWPEHVREAFPLNIGV